ncbi:hypothetical protein [Brevundimonas vesicularis]|uniref:hypothetical protein n=1 Tax=Brevundimonas vesicularis TaxID=41276 RepID=UPI0038D46B5C
MNRRIFAAAVTALGCIFLAGCDSQEERASGPKRQDDGWTTAPRVETVLLKSSAATISGIATPDARVLLRGDEGEAYAVAADDRGRFVVTISLTDSHVMLTPEILQGQNTVRGPEHLLILTEPGLAVMQTEGGSSRRLTPGPLLDAIDGDGQALIASGRARPQETVRVSVPGRYETAIRVGDNGRWVASLAGIADEAVTVMVNNQAFAYPGPAGGLDGKSSFRLEASGGGWLLTRRLGAEAMLTSWFPQP